MLTNDCTDAAERGGEGEGRGGTAEGEGGGGGTADVLEDPDLELPPTSSVGQGPHALSQSLHLSVDVGF